MAFINEIQYNGIQIKAMNEIDTQKENIELSLTKIQRQIKLIGVNHQNNEALVFL